MLFNQFSLCDIWNGGLLMCVCSIARTRAHRARTRTALFLFHPPTDFSVVVVHNSIGESIHFCVGSFSLSVCVYIFVHVSLCVVFFFLFVFRVLLLSFSDVVKFFSVCFFSSSSSFLFSFISFILTFSTFHSCKQKLIAGLNSIQFSISLFHFVVRRSICLRDRILFFLRLHIHRRRYLYNNNTCVCVWVCKCKHAHLLTTDGTGKTYRTHHDSNSNSTWIDLLACLFTDSRRQRDFPNTFSWHADRITKNAFMVADTCVSLSIKCSSLSSFCSSCSSFRVASNVAMYTLAWWTTRAHTQAWRNFNNKI